jgi:hypothetical protein
MNILQETRCNVCNEKMEYLDYELTVIPFLKDGTPIGVHQKQKVCNVRFYCKNCKVNMAKPYPYNDEKFIKPFIEDNKRHSVKFESQEYIEI